MSITQRRSRRRIAGETLNGFEFWRRLHWDHLHGEEACDLNGALDFKTFPRCNKFGDLQTRVDEWLLLKEDVARGTPDKSPLLGVYDILPQEYAEQLKDDPSVATLDAAIERVTTQCRRHNQTRLAQLARTKRQAALKQAGVTSFVHAAQRPSTQNIPDLTKPITETVVAAMENNVPPRERQPRRDMPRREKDRSASPLLWRTGACLECGSTSRKRHQCDAFKAKLKNWPNKKAPKGYMGTAYYADMEKAG